MSLKTKILVSLVTIYTIVVTVLLIIVGQKLTVVNTEKLKYQELETLIKEVKKSNQKFFDSNEKNGQKIDSLTNEVDRVNKGIMGIQSDKADVRKRFDSQISILKNKSLDSLKIIALEP
jgi:uncharacterized membrane-anchored protein YitT (DUF2179 family)